jgi:hypothetical protein
MGTESIDSQILAQEQWSIELLARETHTAIATVQQVFLEEYKKLAAHAHITMYLPLLTCNTVRGILESLHAGNDAVNPAG